MTDTDITAELARSRRRLDELKARAAVHRDRQRRAELDAMFGEWRRGDPAEYHDVPDRSPALLAAINARPSWHADAGCLDAPTAVFFPGVGQSAREALEICGRCPVRVECLDEAMADADLDYGIRGGLSARARVNRRRLDAKRGTTP